MASLSEPSERDREKVGGGLERRRSFVRYESPSLCLEENHCPRQGIKTSYNGAYSLRFIREIAVVRTAA